MALNKGHNLLDVGSSHIGPGRGPQSSKAVSQSSQNTGPAKNTPAQRDLARFDQKSQKVDKGKGRALEPERLARPSSSPDIFIKLKPRKKAKKQVYQEIDEQDDYSPDIAPELEIESQKIPEEDENDDLPAPLVFDGPPKKAKPHKAKASTLKSTLPGTIADYTRDSQANSQPKVSRPAIVTKTSVLSASPKKRSNIYKPPSKRAAVATTEAERQARIREDQKRKAKNLARAASQKERIPLATKSSKESTSNTKQHSETPPPDTSISCLTINSPAKNDKKTRQKDNTASVSSTVSRASKKRARSRDVHGADWCLPSSSGSPASSPKQKKRKAHTSLDISTEDSDLEIMHTTATSTTTSVASTVSIEEQMKSTLPSDNQILEAQIKSIMPPTPEQPAKKRATKAKASRKSPDPQRKGKGKQPRVQIPDIGHISSDSSELDDQLPDVHQVPEPVDTEMDDMDDSFMCTQRDPSLPLCPFCDECLPRHPTSRLKKLLEMRKSSPQAKKRPTISNPDGLYLPSADTATLCRRHREESFVMPVGEAKGWPGEDEVDFNLVKKRVAAKRCTEALLLVMQGKLESPYKADAIEQWTKKGRFNMRSIMSQLSDFESEIPGYYGALGFEAIYNQLQITMVQSNVLTDHVARPIDVEGYLRRVLVPEAAVHLIQEDQGCDRNTAIEVLKESKPYGLAVHSVEDELDETVEEREEREEAEARARKKARKAAKRQREQAGEAMEIL